jgi:hypothetical protein
MGSCTCPMSLRARGEHSVACGGAWVPNGTAPRPLKTCAVCGADLGPGPFADEPYACSLKCFYALHPTPPSRRDGAAHA